MSNSKQEWVGINGVVRDNRGRVLLLRTEHGHILDIDMVKTLVRQKIYKFYVIGTETGKPVESEVELIRSKDKKGWTLRTKKDKTDLNNLDKLEQMHL